MPLEDDERDALLDLWQFGPILPGRFELPSVADETVASLVARHFVRRTPKGNVISAAGKVALGVEPEVQRSRLSTIKGGS